MIRIAVVSIPSSGSILPIYGQNRRAGWRNNKVSIPSNGSILPIWEEKGGENENCSGFQSPLTGLSFLFGIRLEPEWL